MFLWSLKVYQKGSEAKLVAKEYFVLCMEHLHLGFSLKSSVSRRWIVRDPDCRVYFNYIYLVFLEMLINSNSFYATGLSTFSWFSTSLQETKKLHTSGSKNWNELYGENIALVLLFRSRFWELISTECNRLLLARMKYSTFFIFI